MATAWLRYISLSSRDATLRTERTGFKQRFVLDSSLANVEFVELINLEMQQRTMNITQDQNHLYFSEDAGGEDMTTFQAILPCGTYKYDSFWEALASSMMCAQPFYPAHAIVSPKNSYSFAPLGDTQQVVLVSNGYVPYSLHTFSQSLVIQSINIISSVEAELHFLSSEQYPLTRGAVLEIYHPEIQLFHTRVVKVLSSFAVVIEVSNHQMKTIQRMHQNDAMWKCSPISSQSSIHKMLGFSETDHAQGTQVPVQSISSPAAGPFGLSMTDRKVILITLAPHGCGQGDTIMISGLPRVFFNEQIGRVVSVKSEYHLVVQYDCTLLFDLPPVLSLRNIETNKVVALNGCHVIDKKMGENSMFVELQVGHALPEISLGERIHILGRSLVPEWQDTPCRISSISQTERTLTLQASYPSNRLWLQESSPDVSLLRVGEYRIPTTYIGTGKLDFLRNRRVIYMRLWLGTKECSGVVICRNQHRHDISVFARAQLKHVSDEVTCFLTRADDSAIGYSIFSPTAINKVSFVEMEFLSEGGDTIEPSQIGEWSLLIRIGGK